MSSNWVKSELIKVNRSESNESNEPKLVELLYKMAQMRRKLNVFCSSNTEATAGINYNLQTENRSNKSIM
jgi:hypothetical protein